MNHRVMNKEQRKELFLRRAFEQHGDKFDYSKFEYKTAKDASIIICSVHGDFTQTPDHHVTNKHACPTCWNIEKSRVHTGRKATGPSIHLLPAEEYLKKLNLPDKYTIDMSNYQGSTKGTVTLHCPDHGSRTTSPRTMMINRYKCAPCAWKTVGDKKLKGYQSFLERSRELHGDKYTYPFPEEYENRKSILTINCIKHGDFKKKAQKHLAGQGCLRCRLDELIDEGVLIGGYSKSFFKSYPELEEVEGLVYYIKVGSAYKIGITRNKLPRRLAAIKSESKREVKVIDTYTTTLRNAFDIEQKILSDFAEDRTFRRWSTEVFDKDVLKGNTIGSYINATILK
jgi:predicted RNA-binding Zn-ribbon protein involved in translation (DUF1610 family)